MRRSFPVHVASGLAIVFATGLAICEAQDRVVSKPSPQFLRVERDIDGEPTRMQTATVRYQTVLGGAGLTVDLIGAVHIGDTAYYSQLNEQFKQYDVVLYELVAPKGATPDAGRRGENPYRCCKTSPGRCLTWNRS